MTVWAMLVLISSGLFAGSAMAFAWDRVSAWRAMPLQQFKTDFGHTINRADKIQPGLLVVAIVTGVGFGLTASGAGRILALVAAAGFLVVMLASLGILVPLQRRILHSTEEEPATIEGMQRQWFSGHFGRTALSVASFILAATAVSL
jgi:hypothetical protein